MRTNLTKTANLTGAIIQCARKRTGLSQKDLSSLLDLEQSNISRIEKGESTPSVLQWYKFCEILNIPLDALNTGYLDLGKEVKISSGLKEGGFKLPKIYSENRCLSVRQIAPVIAALREKAGGSFLEKMVEKMGLDLCFFTNLENTLNLKFLEDLLAGTQNIKNEFQNLKGFIKDPIHHGVLSDDYQQSINQIDLLAKYIKNISKYNTLFDYQIEKINASEMEISMKFNPKMEPFTEQISLGTIKYIKAYQEEIFKGLSLFDFMEKKERLKEILVSKEESLSLTKFTLNIAN